MYMHVEFSNVNAVTSSSDSMLFEIIFVSFEMVVPPASAIMVIMMTGLPLPMTASILGFWSLIANGCLVVRVALNCNSPSSSYPVT